MAVDHDQKAAGVVSGGIKAAHADAMVGAVITAVKAADGGERFSQSAIPILADILGGEDGYAGGGVLEDLRVKGGGFDADVE